MTNRGSERVTYRTENGGRRTIYLSNVVEGGNVMGPLGRYIVGIEVNREGDEVSGKGFDQRQHLISLDAIVSRKPVVMDNIYGEYVDA